MKMRDLEARTGVNRETIRVFFRNGLLPEPHRPARNVADYDETHVRAILAVRELQRDSGLTLAQIKSALAGNASRRLEAGAFHHLEELLATRVGIGAETVPVDVLHDSNPSAETDVDALEQLGLVSPQREDGGVRLTLSDAKLIEIWGRMRQVGFIEQIGFSPDILSYYREASEYVAANEARLFLERVSGRIDEERAATMLQQALPLMLDFFGLLRQKSFMRFIHDATQDDAPVLPEPAMLPPIAPGERDR
ncbi:MerR family transcriptional regulator [Sphingomonas sp. ID0503]|uniref:MerR family transcriptional regulator n=1 Tax=Sphingomonas sp. ID0503 TaxID=3399691 RepID=UPI003AFAF397